MTGDDRHDRPEAPEPPEPSDEPEAPRLSEAPEPPEPPEPSDEPEAPRLSEAPEPPEPPDEPEAPRRLRPRPRPPDTPQGLNIRAMAPPVGAITNVTALIGRDFEPQRCHIYIRDGVIAGISPVSEDATPLVTAPPPQSELLEGTEPMTIDGKDLIAVPGMVDVHDHLRVLAPGLPVAEGLPLDEFLRVQWATQAHMSTDEYEAAAVLGCVQRLKCGITAVVDHAYTFHEPGLDEACIAAYEACGIRWAYARGIMTRPYEPVCESFEQAADNIRALLEETALTPERLFVAPVSIRQATVEEFARSAALAAGARRRHLHPRLGDRGRAGGVAAGGRGLTDRGSGPGRFPHRAHRFGSLRDPRRRRDRSAG